MPRIRILPLAIVFGLLTIVCLTALKWSPLGIGVSTLTVVFLFILRIVKNRRPEEKIRGDNGWKRAKRTLKSEFAAVMISVVAAYILFGAVQRLPEPVGPWMIERAAWAAPRAEALEAIKVALDANQCDEAENLIRVAYRKNYLDKAQYELNVANLGQCRKPKEIVTNTVVQKETVVVMPTATPAPQARDLGPITVDVRDAKWDDNGAGPWSSTFTVFDESGNAITDLESKDVMVVVDGLRRDYTMGSGETQIGTPPQQVVFVVDTSGSMLSVGLDPIRSGIALFGTTDKTEWRFGLVQCGGEQPRALTNGLTDFGGLVAPMHGLQVRDLSRTPLFASIVTAANMAGSGGNAIVFTDGTNTSSTNFTLQQAISTAQSIGVRVHVVGLVTDDYAPGPMQRIAQATGGVYLDTPDPNALAGLFGQVAESMFAYSLSGYSTSSAPKIVIGANNAVIDLFTGQVTTDPGLIQTMISYR